MLFGIFGVQLNLAPFQRNCVWSMGSEAERPLGPSVERGTAEALRALPVAGAAW